MDRFVAGGEALVEFFLNYGGGSSSPNHTPSSVVKRKARRVMKTAALISLCSLSYRFRAQLKFLAFVLYTFYVAGVSALWRRDSVYWWTEHMLWMLGIKTKALPKSSPLLENTKVLYLLNHSSWADFFIHFKVLNYQANVVSRMMVAIAFPMIYLGSRKHNDVWFFERGKHPITWFYQWLDQNFADQRLTRNGLLVYPEGHRNRTKMPLPLKQGMLKYAYDRSIPVQVVITKGAEKIMNESTLAVKCGVDVMYHVRPPVYPADFENYEEFAGFVEDQFKDAHKLIFLGSEDSKGAEDKQDSTLVHSEMVKSRL